MKNIEKKIICIDGENYEISSNCDIAIYVDGYCNADCKFCIAQMRYGDRTDTFKKPRISNSDQYIERVDELLKILAPLDLSVSLTGGEPTKSKRLHGVAALLEKHKVRRRSISTNGSGLLDIGENGKRCIDMLLDYGVDIFNISRQHHEEERNNYLMNYLSTPCTNDAIAEIIKYATSRGAFVRMSGSVMTSGVDTAEELMHYIEFYQKMGCKDFRFRELMRYADGSTINEEKMRFCREHHIPMEQILDEISNIPSFKCVSGSVDTAVYTYKVFDYQESKLLLQVENREQTIQMQKENKNNTLHGLIIHQNGDLATSWADATKVLSRYEEKK